MPLDPLGLKPALDKLQNTLEGETAAITAIETKTSADVNVIVDKVLEAVVPELRALHQELQNGLALLSANADRALTLAERIHGARTVTTFELAPEKQS